MKIDEKKVAQIKRVNSIFFFTKFIEGIWDVKHVYLTCKSRENLIFLTVYLSTLSFHSFIYFFHVFFIFFFFIFGAMVFITHFTPFKIFQILIFIINLLFQPQHKGQYILEYVCKQLNIIETDYFGLRYVDHCRQRVSLNLLFSKSTKK